MNFCKHAALAPTRSKLVSPQFKVILGKHRGAVKAILLNQQLIAGIGNLYADEILFRARMHPATEAARLSDKDLARLFRATRDVLEKAIALKTDFNRLPKSWLLTHRGKARQMSALRSRVEISNDRRPHFMVLRALPEAKRNVQRVEPETCALRGHCNNVEGALVPRLGFILHHATKAKVRD